MTIDFVSVTPTDHERRNPCRYPVHKAATHAIVRSVRGNETKPLSPGSPTSTVWLSLRAHGEISANDTVSSVLLPERPVSKISCLDGVDALSITFEDDSSMEDAELLGLRCLDDMDYTDTDESEDDWNTEIVVKRFAFDEVSRISVDDRGYIADTEGGKRACP